MQWQRKGATFAYCLQLGYHCLSNKALGRLSSGTAKIMIWLKLCHSRPRNSCTVHWGFENHKKGFAFWAVEFYLMGTDGNRPIESVSRGHIGYWEDPFPSGLQYWRNGRVSLGLFEHCPSHAHPRNVEKPENWLTRSILNSILHL